MIWGKTNKQREEELLKIGDEKVSFAYWPYQLEDGRWVWLERVKGVYAHGEDGYFWSWREVVKRPAKIYGRDNLIA